MTEHTESHTESHSTEGRRVPVQRLRLGDHTCMDFADVEARWEVLTSYTRTGLARGEKVMVVLDPSDLKDDDAVARLDGGTGHVEAARTSGQLDVTRNSSVYLPDGRFDKDRQFRTYAAAGEKALEEGFAGLRLGADMSWATRAGVPDDDMVEYESFIEPLFGPRLGDRRFVAICWYDRRHFSDYLVAAMRRVHPLQVMEHLDVLEVTPAADGARIAGSAEVSTREEFTDALREALRPRPEQTGVRIEIDLTDLCYMEAHCAWQLIEYAKALPEVSTLVIRCGPILELVLRDLGADAVPQLELSVEDTEGVA